MRYERRETDAEDMGREMMEVFDCPQRSPEWYDAHVGVPSASSFGDILTTGRGYGAAQTRQSYLYRLAGERVTGEAAEHVETRDMRRGKKLEPQAQRLYELTTDREVKHVGLIRNHGVIASPDGLIGDDGLYEAKTTLPRLLIPFLLGEGEPEIHMPQVQGQLWVAEREWVDLFVFWPGMPPYLKRIYRDERYIAWLRDAIGQFLAELESLTDTLRAYGKPGYNPRGRVPDATDLGPTSAPVF